MLKKKIPVFYRPEMVAYVESFSKSSSKPSLVIGDWLDKGFPIDLRSFPPVTVEQLCLAHEHQHVIDVLSCEKDNGFGTRSAAVAASLPYTVGSMVAAATEAMINRVGAVSPTSGFHHASYQHCYGFCTFNGLMVAALSFPELKIGILDFDEHYGDGTQDIIDRLHVRNVVHYTQGEYGQQEGAVWLRRIPQILERFKACDLVLYQAGQDPHKNDPLGGWLTTSQLFQRDSIVFQTLRNMRVPVAWNLAGGYQADISNVILGHCNTMYAFSDML